MLVIGQILKSALEDQSISFDIEDIAKKTDFPLNEVSRILNNQGIAPSKFLKNFEESYNIDLSEYIHRNKDSIVLKTKGKEELTLKDISNFVLEHLEYFKRDPIFQVILKTLEMETENRIHKADILINHRIKNKSTF